MSLSTKFEHAIAPNTGCSCCIPIQVTERSGVVLCPLLASVAVAEGNAVVVVVMASEFAETVEATVLSRGNFVATSLISVINRLMLVIEKNLILLWKGDLNFDSLHVVEEHFSLTAKDFTPGYRSFAICRLCFASFFLD